MREHAGLPKAMPGGEIGSSRRSAAEKNSSVDENLFLS